MSWFVEGMSTDKDAGSDTATGVGICAGSVITVGVGESVGVGVGAGAGMAKIELGSGMPTGIVSDTVAVSVKCALLICAG